MWKRAAALFTLILTCLVGSRSPAQEKKVTPPQGALEFKIPPEEAKRENPIKATASSIAEGKRLYGTQCAMCHGINGDGEGDLAQDMKLKLRDYRDPEALKNTTDGELFYILTKGKGDMPGQEGRMKPEQCWHLINYIRSFAKKKETQARKEEKPQ